MKKILLPIFLPIVFSCEKRKFDEMTFFYSDTTSDFSMRFNRGDTVYIKEFPPIGFRKDYSYIIEKEKSKKRWIALQIFY